MLFSTINYTARYTTSPRRRERIPLPRPARLVASLVFAIGLCSSAFASTCIPVDTIRAFLEKREADKLQPSHPSLVIAFDHRLEIWIEYYVDWNGDNATVTVLSIPNPNFEIGPDNVPVFRQRKDLTPLFVVTDTNPLVYSVRQTEVTVSNTADIEQLKVFLQRLGGTLAGWLAVERTLKLDPTASPPVDSATLATYGVLSTDPVVNSLPTAIDQYNRLLQERIDRERSAVDDLDTAAGALLNLTKEIDKALGDVVSATQQLELGSAPADTGWMTAGADQLDASRTVRTNLYDKRTALEDALSACHEAHSLLAESIDIMLETVPAAELAGKQLTYTTDLAALKDTDRQTAAGCSGEEATAFHDLAAALGKIPVSTESRDTIITNAWLQVRANTEVYLRLSERSSASLTQSTAVLDASPALVSTAAGLQRFVNLVAASNTTASDSCAFRAGVLEIRRPPAPWRWDKVVEETAKITARGLGVLDGIVKDRGTDVEFSYKIQPKRTFEFSLSFGLIYTEIVDPTWGAVADPTDSTRKVIARTEEAIRAGAPTALLTLHPFGFNQYDLRPGFDIGVSWDSSSPGFMAGGSVGLTRFLRLGAGWNWQQVTELAPGQNELSFNSDGTVDLDSLSVVSGADDIRTQDTFENGYYISLVFNFSGIDLFKPRE